jgi:hypothetical protein
MALDDLEPATLAKTLGYLAGAQALMVDVLRGKPVSKADAAAVRQAFIFVRKTLDALDEQSNWNAVPNVRLIIAAGDALAGTPSADVSSLNAWKAATDPWRT